MYFSVQKRGLAVGFLDLASHFRFCPFEKEMFSIMTLQDTSQYVIIILKLLLKKLKPTFFHGLEIFKNLQDYSAIFFKKKRFVSTAIFSNYRIFNIVSTDVDERRMKTVTIHCDCKYIEIMHA